METLSNFIGIELGSPTHGKLDLNISGSFVYEGVDEWITKTLNKEIKKKIRALPNSHVLHSVKFTTSNNSVGGYITLTYKSNAWRHSNDFTKDVDELMSDLRRGIFSELKSNAAIDMYRRNLQKVFVSRVIDVALADKTATGNFDGKRISVLDTDIPSIAKGQLVELKAQLKKASAVATDRLTKFHLNDLVARIENAMKPK